MKYKAGDKFIIEIESRVNSQGLYKVKGGKECAKWVEVKESIT